MNSRSRVGHGMVNRGSVVNQRGSVMHQRRMVSNSMVSHSMVGHSMVGQGMVGHRGGMVNQRSSMNHRSSMVNHRGSIGSSTIVVGLSGVGDLLDHPVAGVMVGHCLDAAVGQGHGVGAGGGVPVPGLLLLEAGPAVVVTDPVVVGVESRLGQVIIGSVLGRREGGAQKGEELVNLGWVRAG